MPPLDNNWRSRAMPTSKYPQSGSHFPLWPIPTVLGNASPGEYTLNQSIFREIKISSLMRDRASATVVWGGGLTPSYLWPPSLALTLEGQYPFVAPASQPHELTAASANTGYERSARLAATRNRLIWVALPCLVSSVALLAFGSVVDALAPFSIFLSIFGSIVVLQMKISNVTQ